MKAGLAASVIAVKAIKQAGIIPKVNIVVTGVAGAVENVLNFFIEQVVISRKQAPPVETLYTTKFTG